MSRQGELLSDMGPVILARRMDKGSNRCIEVCKASAGVPRGFGVDVHREAQRKETKSILRSCTAKGAATPKRVSFALDLISDGVSLQLCAQREERWSHDNSQSDVLCGTPRWGGGAGHLSEKVQALRCGGASTSVGSGVAR
ncbi:hypothetical protein Acr_13g0008230 [Actinidia rufa]|uniref:Uncharacterized protein n=1 Tax=Actinidia rufa TaxID=165716 RepID=A0A7J0FL36_9ERIC|nr:hypothetical protein Acr_13g0008230 [Actinidia rufa]